MFNIEITGSWRPGQVLVAWGESSFSIDARIEQMIDRAWAKASARLGEKLFDGPLCRLESWSSDEQTLRLTVSRTSYRLFVGTNLSNAPLATNSMANPIGVSALLETSDGWLLLGRRNESVAYYPNRVHPFAGSLEPNDPIDVFNEVRRELHEELAMTPDDIADMRCLGMVEDVSMQQPELVFHVRVGRARREIEANLDRAEHTDTYAIRSDHIDDKILQDPILTPVAAASLVLFK